jgi:hypothetical protein
MAQVTTALLADTLERTLRGIISDEDERRQKSVIPKLYDEETSTKAWEDYQEYAGPAYISEKKETEAVDLVRMYRGYSTRIWMRTFAAKMQITAEAEEDCLYPEAIRLAQFLREAAFNTRELDAALTFGRAFNTDYPMGDGEPLCSASHLLADGRTWSNVMATPAMPGYHALMAARSIVKMFPNHAGVRSPRSIELIAHPVEQDGAWDAVLNSQLAPYAGNMAEINVVKLKDSGIKHLAIPQLMNTDTDWFCLTDHPIGIKWFTRTKLSSWTRRDNDPGGMTYGIRERHGRAPVDARKILGVNP